MGKKLVAILIVMAMALSTLSGCATMQKIEQVLCDPTATQVEQAQKAAAFLDMVAGMVGSQYSTWYFVAKNTFLMVRPGLCVAIAQLQEAIRAFDTAVATLQKQEKATGAKATLAVPNIDALRAAAVK